MIGSDIMTVMGVHSTQWAGICAFTATKVAKQAYDIYNTGAKPKEIRTFQVARTSFPAILTVDFARASEKKN